MIQGQRVGPSTKARTKTPKRTTGDNQSITGKIPPHIMEMVVRWRQETGEKTSTLISMALHEFLISRNFNNPEVPEHKNREVKQPTGGGLLLEP